MQVTRLLSKRYKTPKSIINEDPSQELSISGLISTRKKEESNKVEEQSIMIGGKKKKKKKKSKKRGDKSGLSMSLSGYLMPPINEEI